jgi:hypothetical protein
LNFFYNIPFKLIDRGIIEYIGPLNIVRLFNNLSYIFSNIQTGYIYQYFFIILLGIIFLLFFTIFNTSIFFFFNIGINLLVSCVLTSIIFCIMNKKEQR